jgi:hypothetical protein
MQNVRPTDLAPAADHASPVNVAVNRVKELSLRQRFEGYRGVLQSRAHRHHFAPPNQ